MQTTAFDHPEFKRLLRAKPIDPQVIERLIRAQRTDHRVLKALIRLKVCQLLEIGKMSIDTCRITR